MVATTASLRELGLTSEDAADAELYMLTRPCHINIRDLVMLRSIKRSRTAVTPMSISLVTSLPEPNVRQGCLAYCSIVASVDTLRAFIVIGTMLPKLSVVARTRP